MAAESDNYSQLKIAHVLFTDIVGYSKKPIDQQSELLGELNRLVRATEQFKGAEAAGKLVRLPTGDGMALAFFTSVDAPVRCALEISEALTFPDRIPHRIESALKQMELVLTSQWDYKPNNFRLDPVWDPIRKDPRFQQMLERKGK
jgi:hypothetical protein